MHACIVLVLLVVVVVVFFVVVFLDCHVLSAFCHAAIDACVFVMPLLMHAFLMHAFLSCCY